MTDRLSSPPKKSTDEFDRNGLFIDGVSAHCPFWVHSSIWTGTNTGRPFTHLPNLNKSPTELESFYEEYTLRLMDVCAEIGVKIIPMFWGVTFGWELATGYPWGFWSGPGFDLIEEGKERFVKKTARIRKHANSLGIYLAHEIHPGTAAATADEFNMLVDICDGDECLTVNADPSHCWEGEDWETRFLKVGPRVYGCHVKNFTIRKNIPLRKMEPDWQKRAMQFTDLGTGDLNLTRYAEIMMHIGYPQRYCQVMGAKRRPWWWRPKATFVMATPPVPMASPGSVTTCASRSRRVPLRTPWAPNLKSPPRSWSEISQVAHSLRQTCLTGAKER